MTITAGARLGPYELMQSLGAGGMGEVFKARDTRLERTVAIKILPSNMAADGDARLRFEREAKAIAALNHPHICTLHDIGHVDGTDFIVMEFVPGETLAQRLQRGSLQREQAIAIACEIADALDKAHRAGIIHRDLKPANIMLSKAGAKLLDFGLAKLTAPPGPISMSGMHPLVSTADGTTPGLVLGTVPYMSPEQVQGRQVDHCVDIWALGAVLHEMLSGKRAFDGDTPAGVIGAILKDTPQPLAHGESTLSFVDAVIARCLEKDPADRWQSAADIQHALALVRSGASPGSLPQARRRSPIPLLGAIAALAIAGAALVPGWWAHIRETPPSLARVSVRVPDNVVLSAPPASLVAPQMALSADGQTLAFIAETPGGRPGLWIRRFDTGVARLLPGTADASYPFWSPDGESLAFFAQGQLKTLKVAGGPPTTLSDAPLDSRGGTWGQDGTILFVPMPNGVVYRISSSGGPAVPATEFDKSRQENSHRFPTFLPDGRHFLYVVRSSNTNNWGLALGSLDSLAGTILTTDTATSGQFVPPRHVLYLRRSTLVAQELDLANRRLTGEPAVLAENVGTTSTAYSAFSASLTGHLVYASRIDLAGQLRWFDRSGRELGEVGPVVEYLDFSLSPNESTVVVSRVDEPSENADIWTIDVARGISSKLTTDTTNDASAVWSPDGTSLMFRSNRRGTSDAFLIHATKAGREEHYFGESSNLIVSDWSADGRWVIYTSAKATGFDLWAVPTSGERKAIRAASTTMNAIHGHLSPDGQWLAYASDESGRWQVYVQRFPSAGDRKQISADGGSEPQWRRDGRELFFLSSDMKLMSVAIPNGDVTNPGVPRALFQTQVPLTGNPYRINYAATRDGQRFLVNVRQRPESLAVLDMIQHWPALLPR